MAGVIGVIMRSIPACAGEAKAQQALVFGWGVYPRVCGGSPRQLDPLGNRLGLSPRVRGKLWSTRLSPATMRSIPACAGEAPPL